MHATLAGRGGETSLRYGAALMLDALGTLVGVALLVVGSVAIACALDVRGRAGFVAGAMVIAAASVVLATIVLSLFDAFTQFGLIVTGLLIAAGGVAGWARAGRPRPPGGWRTSPRVAWAAARAYPVLTFLVVVATLAMALQLLMGVDVAPTNWDSMSYHLSRAAYWLQQHSATHFSGGSIRQLGSAPNGEILQAWSLAITGTDRFVAMVQWLALVGIAFCTYFGAGLLGFDRRSSVFAAALFVVLPQPILQSSSTQNDLIAAFFVLATAMFAVRGLRDRHPGDVAVAALAAGVAVGTKGTVLALAPSLAIIVGAAIWRYRPPARFVVRGVAGLVVATIALGAWGYALNVDAGDPVFGGLNEQTQRESAIGENEVRALWTFVDSPGSGALWFNTFSTKLAHKTVGHLEIPQLFAFNLDDAVSEDTSAYGLIGWLALFPLLFYVAFARGSGERRPWAIAALVGIVLFPIVFEFNIWVGRLMLPTVALAAPLFATLARRPGLAGASVAAVMVALIPCLIVNPNKLLLVPEHRYKATQKSRVDQMTALRRDMRPVIVAVNRQLGTTGALAFVGSEDSWDYPLFGEHLERRLVRFSSLRAATPQAIAKAHVKGILFANLGRPSPAFHAHPVGPDYWFVKTG
jgi:hypothetical protein